MYTLPQLSRFRATVLILSLFTTGFAALSPAMAEIPVDQTKTDVFSGYFRSGMGLNDKGGNPHHFLDSRLGRLGNEDTTYAELAWSHRLVLDNGTWFSSNVLMSFGTDQPTDYEPRI